MQRLPSEPKGVGEGDLIARRGPAVRMNWRMNKSLTSNKNILEKSEMV